VSVTEYERRSYAAERWARAMVTVLVAADDPKTLTTWGRLVGASGNTLVTWCHAAQVSPRRSLELARLCRALLLTGGIVRDLQAVLDIIEPRSVQRLLTRAGLVSRRDVAGRAGMDRVPLDRFLEQQQLVRNAEALRALGRMLPRAVGSVGGA
jgi:hypothetical protein